MTVSLDAVVAPMNEATQVLEGWRSAPLDEVTGQYGGDTPGKGRTQHRDR